MFKRNRDWIIVGGLLLLGFVPMIAGLFRLGQFTRGAMSAENARFFESPAPVSFHIVSAVIYSMVGALQFAPRIRARWPVWHRRAGKLLVVAGVLVATTGLWMTQFYPAANDDGVAVYFARLLVGVLMLAFIAVGVNAIRKRDFVDHGRWMLRAYALGLGAGTQVLTHLPWLLFPSVKGEVPRALSMTAGWLINAAVAEWVITRSVDERRVRSF
jgi:uncharacterized membrane protein